MDPRVGTFRGSVGWFPAIDVLNHTRFEVNKFDYLHMGVSKNRGKTPKMDGL